MRSLSQEFRVSSNWAAGLIYKDFRVGQGTPPQDGEQVTFQYTAYNESGRLIDTTYRQDRPAETRLGINGLIPGAKRCMLPHLRQALPVRRTWKHSSAFVHCMELTYAPHPESSRLETLRAGVIPH